MSHPVAAVITQAEPEPEFSDFVQPDAAHFAQPICHNCGADLHTPCCPQCGQPRAKRMGKAQVGVDIWDEWGMFGLDFLQSAWNLLRGPGKVAREFVLGARARHVNPFKLLLIGITVLVLVLSQVNYLGMNGALRSCAIELAQAWSNASFSLRMLAFFLATWLVWRRRGGYNGIELLVLACYAQFLLICISVVSKLPLLIWHTPEIIAVHKAWSPWLLHGAAALIACAAWAQFFPRRGKTDGWRYLVGLLVLFAIEWALVQAYAELVVWAVLAQLS